MVLLVLCGLTLMRTGRPAYAEGEDAGAAASNGAPANAAANAVAPNAAPNSTAPTNTEQADASSPSEATPAAAAPGNAATSDSGAAPGAGDATGPTNATAPINAATPNDNDTPAGVTVTPPPPAKTGGTGEVPPDDPRNAGAPDPVAWAHAAGFDMGSGAYLSRVAVVDSLGTGTPHGAKIDAVKFSRLTYLDISIPRDLAWAMKLNAAARSKAKLKTAEQKIAYYLRLAGAEALLVMVKDKPDAAQAPKDAKDATKKKAAKAADDTDDDTAPRHLSLVRLGEDGKLASLAGGEVITEMDPKHLAIGLQHLLGYNGVVLAQKDRFVLAQTPDLSALSGISAVAMQDTAGSFSVSTPNAHGMAVLDYVKGAGKFSVFRIVSADSSAPLPFATKLVVATEEQARQ